MQIWHLVTTSCSKRPRKDGGTLDIASLTLVSVRRNGLVPFVLEYVPVSFSKILASGFRYPILISAQRITTSYWR
jgi:hypothetical protein